MGYSWYRMTHRTLIRPPLLVRLRRRWLWDSYAFPYILLVPSFLAAPFFWLGFASSHARRVIGGKPWSSRNAPPSCPLRLRVRITVPALPGHRVRLTLPLTMRGQGSS